MPRDAPATFASVRAVIGSRAPRLVMSTLTLVLAAACSAGTAAPSSPSAPAAASPPPAAPLLVDLERGPIADRVRQRVAQALARPDVDRSFDRMIERVAAGPGVAESGERLLGELAADPVIAEAFGALLEDVGEHPAMLVLVTDLAAKHPDLSPDQISEKVGAHLELAMGPLVDGLIEGPELAVVIDQLDTRVSQSPHLRLALGTAISAPDRIARWKQRTRELNGGIEPSDARSAELMLDHMLTVDRLARFYLDLTADPTVTRRVTELFRAALDAPAFRAEAVRAVRALVAEPSFRASLLGLFGVLLEPAAPANVAERTARARVLLERAGVARAVAGFVHAVVDDPTLASLGDRALADLMADASVTALCDAMFDRW
jgi:hypothetical protein